MLVSDPCDIEITVTGIRYLKENSTMKKVGDALKDAVDIIASLAELLAL
ncbi:MAG: YjcQ family protein [Clostridia bacterium]|nr:YjcQ family protein [Clostridia bacterium]